MDRKHLEKVKRIGLLDKFEKAKEEGLIKHIGFSFHDTLPVFKEIIDYYDWDMIAAFYEDLFRGLLDHKKPADYDVFMTRQKTSRRMHLAGAPS